MKAEIVGERMISRIYARTGPGLRTKHPHFFLFLYALICFQLLAAQDVKTVYIPGEDLFKAEENATRETVVKNLSEDGIYYRSQISTINGFLYLSHGNDCEIIKLSPQGKLIKRFGKMGEGPGEFLSLGHHAVRQYRDNVAVYDLKASKVIVYSPGGKFIREFRLQKQFTDFFTNKKEQFVFSEYSSGDRYFSVYDERGNFLYKFGKKITTASDYKKAMTFDAAQKFYYVPEYGGIWVSFKNRYDLRYYENSKLKVEIKGPRGYFKSEIQEMHGRKFYQFKDKGRQLGVDNDRLFYFYKLNDKTYCDIFDYTDYMLQRRVRFKGEYRFITLYKKNVFYAVITEDDEERDDENVLLVKLEILEK